MAEHAESPSSSEETRTEKRADVDWRRGWERTASVLASVVRWVGLIFAALLVLHVIFVIGSANTANGIVSFVRGWADSLALGFRGLFTPSDVKLQVLVNYGIAALFWLILSAIVAKIIRRLGGISA